MNTQKARKSLQTRKETTMKNTITRVDALNIAINSIPMDIENPIEVVEVLTKIRDQIAKPRKSSDETKAKAKAKRADARATLMTQVLPILRKYLSNEYRQNFCDGDARKEFGYTAKELYAEAKDALPEDFTSAKVQYILLHELADEVVKTEAKGKANTYTLR